MERERDLAPNPRQASDDRSDDDGSLQRRRDAVEQLLAASDQTFDAFNHLNAQQYLHQNLQSGGQ